MPSSDGYKNLIPLNKQPKERQREIQRMGGQAMKAKIQAEKEHQNEVRTLCEIANNLMQRMVQNKQTGEYSSAKEVMVAGLIAKAAKGDSKAFDLVSRLINEGVPNKVEITGANGAPLQPAVKYITPETLEEIKKHISDIIK